MFSYVPCLLAIGLSPQDHGHRQAEQHPQRSPYLEHFDTAGDRVGPTAGSCVPLTNNNGTVYTMSLGIGTPAQKLTVVPDTGSFSLVAASTECDDQACLKHNRFDPHESSTYDHPSNDIFELEYGQGQLRVESDYDVVSFYASMDAPHALARGGNVSVSLMRQEALVGFEEAPYDGICGLGKRKQTEFHTTAFLEDMGIYGFTLCLGSPRLTGEGVGGRLEVATQLAVGNPYKPLHTIGQHVWGVDVTSVGVNGQGANDLCLAGQPCAAIIDSGTTLLTFPPEVYSYVFDALDNGCSLTSKDCLKQLENQERCEGAAFDALPNLTFTVGGQPLRLPPTAYMSEMDVNVPKTKRVHVPESMGGGTINVPSSYEEGIRCVPLVGEIDEMTEYGPMMILGMPFLRQYATFFNRTSWGISVAEVPGGSQLCNQCADSLAQKGQHQQGGHQQGGHQQGRHQQGEHYRAQQESLHRMDSTGHKSKSSQPQALQPEGIQRGGGGGGGVREAPPIKVSEVRGPNLLGVPRVSGQGHVSDLGVSHNQKPRMWIL